VTTLRLFEQVKKVFPGLGETEILQEIDNVQKELTEESKALAARGQLVDISTNTAWVLPAEFLELFDVVAYDSNSNPVFLSSYNLAHEIEFGNFHLYSLTETPITGINSGITSIYLEYYKKSATVNSLTSVLEFKDVFHAGVRAGVLRNFYSLYPVDIAINDKIIRAKDVTSIKVFDKEYERVIKRLKRSRYPDATHAQAQNYQFAGKFELPRRTDALGTAQTFQSINALSTIYSKYASWELTYPIGVTASITPVGFTGTISAVITNNRLYLVSTENEFANTMDWDANQEDIQTPIPVGGFSNTTWIFDLPLGDWGTIKFVIFQRI